MKIFFIILFFLMGNVYGEENKFCLVTIAKSGSHLSKRLLERLSGKKGHFVLMPRDVVQLQNSSKFFLWAHFHQENTVKELLELPDAKYIFLIRDLRDVAVAKTCRCIEEQRSPFPRQTRFSKKWLDLSFNDKLSALLKPDIWGISTFLRGSLSLNNFLEYFDNPNVYVTSFEKLVGPQGGGDLKTQIDEIVNIADFLKISITSQEAEEIGKSLFGDTKTFRKGQIGEWKQIFNKENRMLFERYLGKLLVQLGYT